MEAGNVGGDVQDMSDVVRFEVVFVRCVGGASQEDVRQDSRRHGRFHIGRRRREVERRRSHRWRRAFWRSSGAHLEVPDDDATATAAAAIAESAPTAIAAVLRMLLLLLELRDSVLALLLLMLVLSRQAG